MNEVIKAGLRALKGDRRGVTAVEYAVIAGVMVVAVAAAFTAFGSTLLNYLTALSL
jgi:Flp pilus assembly pilin Flp